MTRRAPVAPIGDTLIVLGDAHFETPATTYPQSWHDVIARDLRSLRADGWVQAGDYTTNGSAVDRAAFAAWWASVVPDGAPSVIAGGNHDPSPTSVAVDVGARLRVLAPPAEPMSHVDEPMRLGAATLAWLEDECAGTDRSVVVVFHAPLRDTVNAAPAVGPMLSSSVARWHAHDDAQIRAALARHRNVAAWVSGHTHSPLRTPDLARQVRCGPVRLAAVSASSPLPIPYTHAAPAALVSCHLTVTDAAVVVRYRDHAARQWLAPVRTVSR